MASSAVLRFSKLLYYDAPILKDLEQIRCKIARKGRRREALRAHFECCLSLSLQWREVKLCRVPYVLKYVPEVHFHVLKAPFLAL